MQGRRLTALISTLLLTFFLASFLPSQASSLTTQEDALSEPVPEHLSALWVLNHGGITRLDSDTGDVVLTLPNTRQARAFAVDESSAQVWVLLRRNLQAWSFGGELA
ncbi:MAG: hypothetical protein PF495_18150, partial [Spirochaetales bacterium]|nr:hypothetical protein [Spirochaetales bacterium]